jgi:hypothetical protein
MGGESQIMTNKAVVIYFKKLSRNLSGETEENWPPGRHLKSEPVGHDVRLKLLVVGGRILERISEWQNVRVKS